jgi:hypothetical protein
MVNQITLKNLKIFKRMSRETTAFTATIWIDGASLCAVRNDGSGGETFVSALNWMRPAIKAIEAANGLRLEEIVDRIVEDFLEDEENSKRGYSDSAEAAL